jgi:hypothetical protein
MFVLEAVCRNCRVWPNGFIDIESTAHSMIYAFGPGNVLQSDSADAPLKRHIRYGKFTMDMKAATGKGGVPAASEAMGGVEMVGGMTRDHDRANLAHAVLGSLALFVLWPLNVVLAGFFRRIGIHVGMSVGILVFLVISYALGIWTSGEYNRVCSSTHSPAITFANIHIVQSIQLPPPDPRLLSPPPHPPPQRPTHKIDLKPSRKDSPTPCPPHNPHLPPPDTDRRSGPPPLLLRPPYNTRIRRHRPTNLCLHHAPANVHTAAGLCICTGEYEANVG